MKYYTQEQNKTAGPYSLEELRAKLGRGEISPTDQVCAEGTETWLPLATILQQAPSPYESAPVTGPATTSTPPRRRGGCCGCLFTGMIVIVLLIVASLFSLYYAMLHTALPLKLISAVTGQNLVIKGATGSISSGFSIESIEGHDSDGNELELENVKMKYSDFTKLAKSHELIIEEISVDKARVVLTSSATESTTTTTSSGNATPAPGGSATSRPSNPSGLQLIRIDRIHFANIYFKDQRTNFELSVPEFNYSGFQWTPEKTKLGDLKIDSDRLSVSTQPGQTLQIEGKPVVFQKHIEATLKPLLHHSIKQPIDFTIDAGITDTNKLFYSVKAFDGKLEAFVDETERGYYRTKDLDLSSYLAFPPYDLPTHMNLDVALPDNRDLPFDKQKPPAGTFTLGVTEFTIEPAVTLVEDKGGVQTYEIKAVHKANNGELDVAVHVQTDEAFPHLLLRSNPSTGPRELLAQIFYGKSVPQLTPEEKKTDAARLPVYFPRKEKAEPEK